MVSVLNRAPALEGVRNSPGVLLIRLKPGDMVMAVAKLVSEKKEEEI